MDVKKKKFSKFVVGTVFNSVEQKNIVKNAAPILGRVEIQYPSRLNAMAIDPSKIALNKYGRYTPGEIIFKTKIYKKVSVRILSDEDSIKISDRSKRKPLIMHAAMIMRKALKFTTGLYIDVDNSSEVRHAGLGSSSSLIAAVACAINEIFLNPIGPEKLARYLAQNHGEEIEGDDKHLVPVQCIGGSAIGGLFEGGLMIIAGQTDVIAAVRLDKKYHIVLGIPKNFKQLDADTLFDMELKKIPQFIKCGLKYGPTIAYRLVHEVLPGLVNGDLIPTGNLIYDYRFKMGSIDNCSFAHHGLTGIAQKISKIKTRGLAAVLSLSSVGPSFFALTDKPGKCQKIFQRAGMVVSVHEVENEKYKIIHKKIYGKI